MAGRGDRRDDRRRTVVSRPRQGEIWWAQADDKRRPVLIITRDEAIPVLVRWIVAPVTRTVRRIPTEVPLGQAEGLAVECAASFDDLQPISRHFIAERVGALGPARRHEICAALGALADC